MKLPRPIALLDLADIPDWISVTEQIVNRLVPAGVQEDLRGFDPGQMYQDTMTFLVDSCDRHGAYADVHEWAARFDAAYMRSYTHIRAFHACRVYAGLETYKTHGIQKLSRPLLKELAHLAFAGHATESAINHAVAERRWPDFEESVYLFTDSIHPTDEASNHYLLSGSEMLQALSIDLGLHSRRILASRGDPYLIECNIPVRHVSKGFRHELWRKFITQHFKIRAGAACPTRPYDFCIRVTKTVTPDAIKGFHRIEGKIRSFSPVH